MVLEKEIAIITFKKQVKQLFRRSILAFCLFIVSLGLNLPPYFLSLKYHTLLFISSLFSVICIIAAITMACINVLGWVKNKLMRKGIKSYITLSLNLIIILITLYNAVLWIRLLFK
jgi:hypothetical protein